MRGVKLGAAIVAGVLSVLYGVTLCRTVGWYDSAEFAGVAATLRVVPHPPGYPLYSFLAHAFTWLPGEPALGVNIMSAVFGVVGALLVYLFAVRIGARPAAVAIGALSLGLCSTWWSNAVVAEVYTPGLSFGLAVLVVCHRALVERRAHLAWAAAGIAGAGLGVHMSLATMGLGFLVLLGGACVVDGKVDGRLAVKVVVGSTVALAIGASVLLLVPLGPFEEMTPLGPHHTTPEVMWAKYANHVRGGVFRNYFRSFPILPRLEHMLEQFSLGLLVGVVGLGWSARRRPVVVGALALIVVGNIAYFFRYNVADLDGFLLPSMAALAIGVALFADALGPRLQWAVGVIPVALAISNYTEVDRSGDRSARQYGEAACASIPPGAIMAMTSRPDEWHRYTVLFYMHETGEGCENVEFWGFARRPALANAIAFGRDVFALVPDPRFADEFDVVEAGQAYRVQRKATSRIE